MLLGQRTIAYKGDGKMNTSQDTNKCEKATYAAGCFWHVRYEFDKAPGVISTTFGYTGRLTTISPTNRSAPTKQAESKPSR